MGLDMYLEGDKYYKENFDEPKNNLMEDGFRLKTKRLDLGYWRKHPNLHGYIVKQFANSKDDCHDIELGADDIQTIIEAIKGDSLPETAGFFFGQSYTGNDGESYDAQKREDITVFKKALKWMNEKDSDRTWRSILYRASW